MLHAFKASVRVQGFKGVLFTSKLVKTILIRRLPELEGFFKPRAGGEPKYIHVSPLYYSSGGKSICLYSYVKCVNRKTAKCQGPLSQVVLNGEYYFYAGFTSNVSDPVKTMSSLLGFNDCFTYMDQRVCVETTGIEYYIPQMESSELVSKLFETGKVKIVFASPTMLRDPFKRTKHKTLIPSVMNIFAVPVYTMLTHKGAFTYKRFRRHLLMLHRIFNEPYSVFKTTGIKWVVYKRRPEPTIIGYVNLYLNQHYYDMYSKNMSIDLKEYLRELFAYTITLGVGVGRATGFGHVFIEVPGNGIDSNGGAGKEDSPKNSAPATRPPEGENSSPQA
ncbi:MAG: CRISPR system precrRNA processing endoribonuclease RAMP protein Cas6 [Thermosphaera sp.]